MPGGQERILRRRISSVQSTKKITRAMELIAATRVVKAMQRANEARPYAAKITGVIEDLAAQGTGINHPLLREAAEVNSIAYVVLTSDRGLAGPFNSSVIRATEREVMAAQTEGKDYRLILVGKKARDYFTFRNYRVDAFFGGMTDSPTYENARDIAALVREMFEAGDVDQVVLTYQEFISMGTQRVAVRRFLPLEQLDVVATEGGGSAQAKAEFEFEPSPEGVLAALLPRYVESRLFSALLDASASEHANRQRAMKAATDNAEELITKLSRALSRARQDSITTEIMEIVGGAEALGDDGGGDADLLLDHLTTGHIASLHIGGDHGHGHRDGPEDPAPIEAFLASETSGSTTTAVAEAELFGAGSHAPLPDNSAPAGFTVKGNTDSMLYHRPDSRSYEVTIAEVWFDTPERAEAAGFTLANTHPKAAG
jgi:F-type H+-transporting ATPase subunit gamma